MLENAICTQLCTQWPSAKGTVTDPKGRNEKGPIMASLVKRGRTYYAQFAEGNGYRRVSLKTPSIQIAKAKLNELELKIARGDANPLPTRTPIESLLEDYVADLRIRKTPRGLSADLFYLRESFGPVCPALQAIRARKRLNPHYLKLRHVEDITTEDVSRFIASRVQERGLAPKTANRYREVLHTFANWAMNERGVRIPGGLNPVSKVKKYREKAPDIRFLRTTDIEYQLSALSEHPQLQAMVAVYLFAGLRREELLWLTRSDFQMDAGRNGTIHIRAKRIGNESWQPKTRVNRAVPISEALHAYLRDYQAAIVPGHWFFPSPHGKRWDADNFSHRLREVNRALKLPWGCLDFRHTFGSHLAMKGESLYKIATLMGNSPEICRRHYATLLPESLLDAVEFHCAGKKAL